jgi:hypothetical protein
VPITVLPVATTSFVSVIPLHCEGASWLRASGCALGTRPPLLRLNSGVALLESDVETALQRRQPWQRAAHSYGRVGSSGLAFVGMLLIPIVALKLASTGWRMMRYYRHGEEYVRRGPPHVALRVFVSPVIVLSTLTLFGSGVALLALDERHGTIALLHKASFIVWVAATGVHVLAHLVDLGRALSRRVPGLVTRLALVSAAVAAGLTVAVMTLPAADHLQDAATAHIGIDAH